VNPGFSVSAIGYEIGFNINSPATASGHTAQGFRLPSRKSLTVCHSTTSQVDCGK
jgi:hypothetical protein